MVGSSCGWLITGRFIPDREKQLATDFEFAAIDAFRITYPNSTITGCYFHLCQSVLRRTQELGLRMLYDRPINDEVRGMMSVFISKRSC